ncbi:Clathrin adaptor complexes medium subunit family protein [Prunus dulcis]|uniref:Clathrin adaptor complexes medium subunit family protein n=1 Tax=Prunus dulcis TaxID=3755 RepID=A0A4Y1RDZ0_PRUDU|nr:Clathrin adaptor complexes medium subunit family protein [Prunus dulcis]
MSTLLDEMIDNGFPLTTEPNIMREMIAPPNIVNKMLSVVIGNSSNMSDTLPGATSSCIPWRTTDLKYVNNEVYVDLVEEMDAIVTGFVLKVVCVLLRDGVLVKCEIYGEVKVNSHLLGVPDLTLSFANPSILDDLRKFLFLDSFVMQIVMDSCCATFAEVQKRGKDFWAEFELYTVDLLVGIAADIALVGMLAPYPRIGKPLRYLVITSILRCWVFLCWACFKLSNGRDSLIVVFPSLIA